MKYRESGRIIDMALTRAQKAQVAMQLRRHDREAVKGRMGLARGAYLDLTIRRGVFGSDMMSSGIYLAKFLYRQKKLYSGKTCLDMGCGAGTQGLIMAKYGARQVDLSDINPKAVKNAHENIGLHRLNGKCNAYLSDLFKGIPKGKKYDVIVFNHPFFPEKAEKFGRKIFADVMMRKSMLGGTELVRRFFEGAKTRMKSKDSAIVMPYFHFAGKYNDPAAHAPKHGFYVAHEQRIKSGQGLQLGDFSIYIIKRK